MARALFRWDSDLRSQSRQRRLHFAQLLAPVKRFRRFCFPATQNSLAIAVPLKRGCGAMRKPRTFTISSFRPR